MLFFKNKPEADPDDFVLEKWVSRFRKNESRRFIAEAGNDYNSDYHGGEFVLNLTRKNLFAWSDNIWYQYRDFNLEADCSFTGSNGYSAMGFCFRKINDANYYYFLVSNRGYFRFDLVFNGTPQIIIPWTSFRKNDSDGWIKDVHLRIVTSGSRFVFLIDEEWIGEADDDSISSGRFAWAGQNYEEKQEACFILRSCTIDSRALEVEASWYRWAEYIPVEPELRLKLAESQFLLGAFSPVLVQLKKISRDRPLNIIENLLAAKSFLGSAMYEEAFNAAEKCLESEPENIDALQVAGTSLYSLNRLLQLKTFLGEKSGILEKESWYWGLAGNGEYGLGNWEEASVYYRKAVEYFPDEPLFRENLARAVEKSEVNNNEKVELLSSYEDAARLYFRQEEYEQVRALLSEIRKVDPENRTADGLEGKILFHEEDWDRAMELFAPIAEAGKSEDSSIYLLYGLLLGFHDLREQSGRYLEKAAEMEPGSFIYQFKAAESLHLRSEDMEPYLKKGLDLAPEDIWINNLAGLDALERGDADRALEFLEKGWNLFCEKVDAGLTHSSGGGDLLINYSQALYDSNRTEEAVAVLNSHEGPEIFNHKGNLLIALRDFPGAVDAYEKAISLNRNNRIYMLNCASACIEADFVHRAEELLQLLDGKDDPEVINLLGNLARIKGEFSRAEAAYEEAMKLDPENRAIILNLAELLHQRGEQEGALDLLERIPEEECSRRGRRLLRKVKEALGK